jgi:hypothetical protein
VGEDRVPAAVDQRAGLGRQLLRLSIRKKTVVLGRRVVDEDVVGERVGCFAGGHVDPRSGASAVMASISSWVVGGVDEGDAFRDDLPRERDTVVVVGVLAPDLRPGQLHRSVADAPDGQVTPDG